MVGGTQGWPEWVRKICPPTGLRSPQTIQPVASWYCVYAILAQFVLRDTADILWYLPGIDYKYLLVWIFEDGYILFLGKYPSRIVLNAFLAGWLDLPGKGAIPASIKMV